jgi:hypothetical protein
MMAAEFLILVIFDLCIGAMTCVKSQNTLSNNSVIVKISNAEACRMQVILHSVVVSRHSEKHFSPKLIGMFL